MIFWFVLAAATDVRAAAYNFTIVAQSGQGGIVSLYKNVSINDSGLVAFAGTTTNGISVFVGDGKSSPWSVTSPPTAGGLDPFLQINNGAMVVTERGPFPPVTSDPVIYYDPILGPIVVYPGTSDVFSFVQLWDANKPTNQQLVAQADWQLENYVYYTDYTKVGAFSYLGPAVSVNNLGAAAFVADTGVGFTSTYVLAIPGMGANFPFPPSWLLAQPLIADTGEILVKTGPGASDPIALYSQDLSSSTTVAAAAMGFVALGNAPGISDDGQYIAFYGELSPKGAGNFHTTPGPGIFLAWYTKGGFSITNLVGLNAADGTPQFSGLDASMRVAVNLQATTRDVAVVFTATNSAGTKGLWCCIFNPTSGSIAGPGPLLQQGDATVTGATVQDICIFDSVNTQEQIAIWTQTDSGQAVMLGNVPDALPVILVHGWRPHRKDNNPSNPVDLWSDLEDSLYVEGYENLSDPADWPTTVSLLPGKVFIEFTYTDDLWPDYPDASGDPREYAVFLQSLVESFRAATEYKGQFDVVCHSMGALVSRWYIDRKNGAKDIRQWIGIAPVNRGAGLADMKEYFLPLLPLFSLPFMNLLSWVKYVPDCTDKGAITQMETRLNNNTVSRLNSPGGLPQVQPGITYRVLAGCNRTALNNKLHGITPEWDPSDYPQGLNMDCFRDNIGKTIVNIGLSRDRATYYGDGVVALEQSKLSGSENIDLFDDLDHDGLVHDPQVLDRVMLYLLNAASLSMNNCPSESELLADAAGLPPVQGNQGYVSQGQQNVKAVLVDPTVKAMGVNLHYGGSEMVLSLVSPSGEAIPSISSNNVAAYVADGFAAISVVAPEAGMWQAVVDPVNVPANGEPYLLTVTLDSDIELDVEAQRNQTVVPVGGACALTAMVQEEGSAVPGAILTGQITGPDGASYPLAFYDDGTHGDTNANDGVFAATATLKLPGGYLVTVQADAQINGEPVQRMASASLWGQAAEQAPVLSISLGEGLVALTWVDPSGLFQLESVSTLSTGATWTGVTNTPVAQTNGLSISLPVSSQRAFYRLVQPSGLVLRINANAADRRCDSPPRSLIHSR